MKLVNPFFGQNMNMVFTWLNDNQIPYKDLTPSQFADLMDEMTGVEDTGALTPEEAANKWLLAIADKERQNLNDNNYQ